MIRSILLMTALVAYCHTPSLLGGMNYAYGGAETGPDIVSGAPGVRGQVSEFLASVAGSVPDPGLLFVVHGGAPDFAHGQTDASIPVANLSIAITDLALAGATRIMVPNLPPLGQLPIRLGTADEAPLDALASEFNLLLASELDLLEANLGVELYRLDLFGFYSERLADPAAFGLANVTDPAWDSVSGDVVPNPDEYFFWDAIHITAPIHEAVAAQAMLMIPEPSTLQLVGLGLGLVLLARRRMR